MAVCFAGGVDLELTSAGWYLMRVRVINTWGSFSSRREPPKPWAKKACQGRIIVKKNVKIKLHLTYIYAASANQTSKGAAMIPDLALRVTTDVRCKSFLAAIGWQGRVVEGPPCWSIYSSEPERKAPFPPKAQKKNYRSFASWRSFTTQGRFELPISRELTSPECSVPKSGAF